MTIAEMRLPHKNMDKRHIALPSKCAVFYLLKMITKVIIKAIFMIVTPINP